MYSEHGENHRLVTIVCTIATLVAVVFQYRNPNDSSSFFLLAAVASTITLLLYTVSVAIYNYDPSSSTWMKLSEGMFLLSVLSGALTACSFLGAFAIAVG